MHVFFWWRATLVVFLKKVALEARFPTSGPARWVDEWIEVQGPLVSGTYRRLRLFTPEHEEFSS